MRLSRLFPLSFAVATLASGGLGAIAQALEPLNLEDSAIAQTLTTPVTESEIAERAQILAPVPGTSDTDAASLSEQPTFIPVPEIAQKLSNFEIAQGVEPSEFRGGASYIGVGANIGLGGGTSIGEFGFAGVSRIGFTQNLSVRPSLILNDRASLLIPVTYDFFLTREPFEPVALAPFIGGGVAFDFSGKVGPMITGGVDFPLTPRFTATGSANVAFLEDDTKFGILIGVGYNFGGLFER